MEHCLNKPWHIPSMEYHRAIINDDAMHIWKCVYHILKCKKNKLLRYMCISYETNFSKSKSILASVHILCKKSAKT